MEDLTQMPLPPKQVAEPTPPIYRPGREMSAWVKKTFIDGRGPLVNPDHAELEPADIAVLWTNETYEKKGKNVLGEARIGEPSGSNKWSTGRTRQQLSRWFGGVPDFLITLDALWVLENDNASVCALIEHELYHCRHKRNRYGDKAFTMDGLPKWMIAPHDVEEFVGVVERYGAEATRVKEFVEAATSAPTVSAADIAGVCGSCMRKVA